MVNRLGRLIKEARQRAGLTQNRLAWMIGGGVTAADISRAERGENTLTQEELREIARITGVTQTSLLEAARLDALDGPVPPRSLRRVPPLETPMEPPPGEQEDPREAARQDPLQDLRQDPRQVPPQDRHPEPAVPEPRGLPHREEADGGDPDHEQRRQRSTAA